MNRKDQIPIESLMKQMSLQKPSLTLDDQIEHLIREDTDLSGEVATVTRQSITKPRQVDWRFTLAASLVAAIAGVFVGRLLPGKPTLPSITDHSSLGSSGTPLMPFASDKPQLSGTEPRIVDEGFQIKNGKPSRVFRLEGTSNGDKAKTRVRNKIVVPSSEI